MAKPPAPWRLILRSYPCPTCGAAVGEPCVTTGGRTADIEHAERARDADRCPKCGAKLDASEPGSLCPRCRLVRALETERATKWIRLDP